MINNDFLVSYPRSLIVAGALPILRVAWFCVATIVYCRAVGIIFVGLIAMAMGLSA